MDATTAEEISLLDYGRRLYKRRRLIASIVAAAVIGAAVVSGFLPKIYAATASVLPPQPEPASPLMPSGGLRDTTPSLFGNPKPSDLWVAILKDQSIADAIIGRFRLRERYGAASLEDARAALAARVKVEGSKEGIVSVSVEERDPRLAADMANAFVDELDRMNRRAVTTAAGRMRLFVERRLVETRAALAAAEDRLKLFQERNRTLKLEDQSAAVIQAFGGLKATLAAKQVELDTLLSYATASHPQVAVLKEEVGALREQLRQIEQGQRGASDIFLPTDRVPDLGVQYARLLREVKYQEALLELLTQQYEMARIQEAKDTPTLQILHAATVPERKAKPSRRRIVLVALAASLFAGVFTAFCLEYLEARGLRAAAAG